LKQVDFLGHVVSKGGISLDPSKIQDVLSCNAPTSVSEIQSFLGLSRYYQRFIKGFFKITKPMTELLVKDKKFKWTPACCCRPKPPDGRRLATREPGGPEPLSVGPAARTRPEVGVRWACHLTYT
jgi:hypothetical protein